MKERVEALLSRWEGADQTTSIEVRLRVRRALAMPGPWTVARLEFTLRAILCHSLAERERFDQLFKQGFSDLFDDQRDQAAPRSAGAADEQSPRAVEQALAERRERDATYAKASRYQRELSRKWVAPFVVTGAMVAGLSLVVSVRKMRQTDQHQAQVITPPRLTPPTITSAPTTTYHATPHQTQPAPSTVTGPVHPWAVASAIIALMGAIVAGFLLYRFIRRARARRQRFQVNAENLVSFLGADLDLRGRDRAEPLTNRELSEIAFNLGVVAEGGSGIDVERTVDASSRAGMLRVVSASARRVPSVVVVVACELDVVSRELLKSLREGLSRRSVTVDLVETLPLRVDHDAGLLVVDASGTPKRAFEWFRGRSNIALVEARDPALWGLEVRNLPAEPQPLTAAGLRDALKAALQARQHPAPCAPVQIDAIERLGAALPLAAAAALVQPVDVRTLDYIRRNFFPDLPFLALQRILATPGVDVARHTISFERPIFDTLMSRIDGRTTELCRQVLQWHVGTRLTAVTVAPGSRADAMLQRELALGSLQLAALAQSAERLEPEVERQLSVLEAQDQHPELQTRLRERLGTVSRWIKDRSKQWAPHLSGGAQERLAKLGLMEAVKQGLAVAEKLRAGTLLLAVLSCIVIASITGFVGYDCVGGSMRCGQACIPATTQCCDSKAVDVKSDASNCGACGASCNPGDTCSQAGCVSLAQTCQPPSLLCAGVCVPSDAANCGACGRHCVAGESCVDGACAARVAATVCGADRIQCGGVCRSLKTDSNNCGRCGNVCVGATRSGLCIDGSCQTCAAGLANCDGSGCKGLGNDVLNCGGCGKVCPGSGPICDSGRCIYFPNRQCTWCGKDCVFTFDDTKNCGGCGNACANGTSCINGKCGCAQNEGVCNGICTNLTSTTNCGQCGTTCAAGQACLSGHCACPTGFATCPANSQTGPQCSTQVEFDPNNCGACGVKCESGNCSLGKCTPVPQVAPAPKAPAPAPRETCQAACEKAFAACSAACEPPAPTDSPPAPPAEDKKDSWSDPPSISPFASGLEQGSLRLLFVPTILGEADSPFSPQACVSSCNTKRSRCLAACDPKAAD